MSELFRALIIGAYLHKKGATVIGRTRFGVASACALAIVVGGVSPATAFGQMIKHTEWVVTKVTPLADTKGPQQLCVEGKSTGKTTETVNCTHSFTASNTVTGTVTVSLGDISDAVGFSVTQSTTWAAGGTLTIPSGQTWGLYRFAVYHNRSVAQSEYYCYTEGAGNCPSSAWTSAGVSATATASQAYTDGYVDERLS